MFGLGLRSDHPSLVSDQLISTQLIRARVGVPLLCRRAGGGAEWRSCARACPLHTSSVDSRICCSLGNFPILSLAHSIFPIFTPSRIGRTQIVFSFRVPSHYKCRPLRSTHRNAAHCVRLGRPFVVGREGGTGIRSYLFSFRSTRPVSYLGTERGALSQCQP